jgi:transposase
LTTESTLVSSRKGRPNYAPEYRRQVAITACEPNVSVAKLAQAHGLNPNMVFKWRRQYRAGLLGNVEGETAALVPVTLRQDVATDTAEPPTPAVQSAESASVSTVTPSLEIELNGARVRVTGVVDPVQLRLVLRCLMPL